ncbi:MAG: DUF6308 family protein [Acidimicrobiales bacterium]
MAAVGSYISGEERPRAVASLRSYFLSGRFTGAHFDRLAAEGLAAGDAGEAAANRFSERDIVAVSMLGVAVPPKVVTEILYDNPQKYSDLLQAISPASRSISDENVDLGPSSAAQQLWDALKHPGMGRTIRSKLMAAKRPHLIPVYDKYVGHDLLSHEADDWWAFWVGVLGGEGGLPLRQQVDQLRAEAEVPPSVSRLRVLDVVIWMRIHGWRWDAESLAPLGFGQPMG